MQGSKATLSVLIAVIASLATAGSAFAGSVNFDFRGTPSTSTAAWAGGNSSLTASADQVALSTPSGGPLPLADARISFTSGPGASGSGTVDNPYVFGPSLADSVIVSGCLPNQGSDCSTVTLFAGQFQAREKAFWSNDRGHFDGLDVSGTINPLLAFDLGLHSYNFIGELQAVIACSVNPGDLCTPGKSRILAGGDLVLRPGSEGSAPTPEPSALLLLGSGMCGVTLILRRRNKNRK